MPRAEQPIVPAAGANKKRPASPVFPIIFTIVADGRLPGRCNLLHIRAKFSEELQWQRNVLPQLPDYNGQRNGRPGKYITRELAEACKPQAIPLAQAMRELREWLSRFKGEVLVVGSCLTFWHLCHSMQQVLGRGEVWPWRMQPLDLASFVAGAKGDTSRVVALREKEPAAAIAEREKAMRQKAGVKRVVWE